MNNAVDKKSACVLVCVFHLSLHCFIADNKDMSITVILFSLQKQCVCSLETFSPNFVTYYALSGVGVLLIPSE